MNNGREKNRIQKNGIQTKWCECNVFIYIYINRAENSQLKAVYLKKKSPQKLFLRNKQRNFITTYFL